MIILNWKAVTKDNIATRRLVVNQKINVNLKGFGEKVGTMKIAANQAAAKFINSSDIMPAQIGFIIT